MCVYDRRRSQRVSYLSLLISFISVLKLSGPTFLACLSVLFFYLVAVAKAATSASSPRGTSKGAAGERNRFVVDAAVFSSVFDPTAIVTSLAACA